MRQDVYTKFAEAVQRKQAEQATVIRHQEVVTKFAEALNHQMAQKQAEAIYCEGFCKAAELTGVDPNALVKQAGRLGMLGKVLALAKNVAGRTSAAYSRGASAATAAGSGIAGEVAGELKAVGRGAYNNASQVAGGIGRRYLELLRNGNKLRTYDVSRLAGIRADRDGGGLMARLKARLGALNGEYSRAARRAASGELAAAERYDASPLYRGLVDSRLDRAVGYEARANQLAAGESELRKVLGARLGTAGVLGAGAYGVGSAVSGD